MASRGFRLRGNRDRVLGLAGASRGQPDPIVRSDRTPAPVTSIRGRAARSDVLARTIVESSLDCIVVMDHRGRIVEFNPAAEAAFGYTKDQALTLGVTDLMPPEVVPAHRAGLATYLETGTSTILDRRFETTARRADGSLFPIELTVTRIPYGTSPIFVGFMRDLSVQKLTTDALRKRTEELHHAESERLTLLRRLVAAHEEERRRIAGAIHEDSIQAVAALAMRVSALRRGAGDSDIGRSLADIEDSVNDAVSRLRHLMFELHPTTLDRGGLAATVQAHVNQLRDPGEPTYRIVDHLEEEPPREARLALYRVIQEAITNARKHARARRVVVELFEEPGDFVARVGDDGRGFRFDGLHSPAGHLGMSAMREQAEMAGGHVSIESSTPGGTTVEVRIPRQGHSTDNDPVT